MMFDDYDAGEAVCLSAGCGHKSDPYGANTPSSIPNPSGGGRGEPVPSPGGLPPEYPAYLKPIPINTRDIEEELRSFLSQAEPRVHRILYSTHNANRQAVKYQEIRNAIRDGEFSQGFLADFEQRYAKMVNDELAPQWEAAMERSASAMAKSVETTFGQLPVFNAASERIKDWIDARGGELAVNLSTEQSRALRSTLKFYTTERPVSATELGRILRAQVGLTAKQAGAVNKFREKLINDDNLDRKTIEHRAQNYAGRLHRIRAERIARTELSFAFNQGALEQMRQATEGVLAGETIVKRWWTGKDEKVCSHCGPLHNVVIGMDETFPGATRKIPNTIMPPAHPSCRCTVIFEVVRPESDTVEDLQIADQPERPEVEPEPEEDEFDFPFEPGSEEELERVEELRTQVNSLVIGTNDYMDAQRELTALAERRFNPVRTEEELFEKLQGTQDELAKMIDARPLEADDILNELKSRPELVDISTRTVGELANIYSDDSEAGDVFRMMAGVDHIDPSTKIEDVPDIVADAMRRAILDERMEMLKSFGLERFEESLARSHIAEESSWENYISQLERGRLQFEFNFQDVAIESAMSEILEDLKNGSTRLETDGDGQSYIANDQGFRYGMVNGSGVDQKGFDAAMDNAVDLFDLVDPEVLNRFVTGDSESDAIIFMYSGKRAGFNYGKDRASLINVGENTRYSTFHELGHLIEKDDSILQAEMQFLARRVRLDETTEDFGDIVVEDDFSSPYTGRVYMGMIGSRTGYRHDSYNLMNKGRASEVFTTGIQEFRDPQNMAKLYREDPEHFAFTLDVLRGEF